MSFLLDLIISLAMISVIITQVLSNFNYVIRMQKSQEKKAFFLERKTVLKELFIKDLSLSFDPTPVLKDFDKIIETAKSKDSSGQADKDSKKDSDKTGKKEDLKIKNKDKDKLPEPFHLSFEQEKYTSKIFKSKLKLAKMFSFVSNNSMTLSFYQPCRVTYLLEQTSGKSDAKEVLYTMYRLETQDLRVLPKEKTVKAQGSVVLDNVLEFSIEPFAHKHFATTFDKDDQQKKTNLLSELMAQDFQASREKSMEDFKKEEHDGDKDKETRNKVFPQLYVIKLACKNLDGKIEKLELEVFSFSACSKDKEKVLPKKDKQEEDKVSKGDEDKKDGVKAKEGSGEKFSSEISFPSVDKITPLSGGGK